MSPDTTRQDFIARIGHMLRSQAHMSYDGQRAEAVSALDHGLQCAQLAEWAGAPASLVAAALLHDIGHFADDEVVSLGDTVDDEHELRALPLLSQGFGAAVLEPIRLHVAAKRYLVATEPGYRETLSPASLHSLMLQGGPMSPDECAAFAALPFAQDALALRRWDDVGKEVGKPTPSLDYYLALLDEVAALDARA
ncbi:MAG: HD domain-containing protein [Roseateles asaccharophilus]|uniref:Phosphonate degradation associated HDIG domain protein n=1 Tax=Roseateles asaccharophilus TaxID=582607 RepID=A0A4R6ND84_9BURK|nr:phosphonate degradation associated HDIG domain protein [Roseateles asaccharophilus]